LVSVCREAKNAGDEIVVENSSPLVEMNDWDCREKKIRDKKKNW